jgi:hypothetical protein
VSFKTRLNKLETKGGSSAVYILIVRQGMTEDEAMEAYLTETGTPPPRAKDLVIVIRKP